VDFFNTLNYSSRNGDGLAELRALDVSPGGRVCRVIGGRDRAGWRPCWFVKIFGYKQEGGSA